jgi:hypothetical protein
MCGLDLFAIRKIDREGFRSRTLVVDIRALQIKMEVAPVSAMA